MNRMSRCLLAFGCAIALTLFPASNGTDVASGQGTPIDSSSIFLPLMANGTFCQSVSEIPRDECRTLAAIYQSTQGQAWSVQTGWLQTGTPCSWQGVSCTEGRVAALDLSQNNLSGPMPPEVGNLTSLVNLYLGNNGLTTLPAEIRQPIQSGRVGSGEQPIGNAARRDRQSAYASGAEPVGQWVDDPTAGDRQPR